MSNQPGDIVTVGSTSTDTRLVQVSGVPTVTIPDNQDVWSNLKTHSLYAGFTARNVLPGISNGKDEIKIVPNIGFGIDDVPHLSIEFEGDSNHVNNCLVEITLPNNHLPHTEEQQASLANWSAALSYLLQKRHAEGGSNESIINFLNSWKSASTFKNLVNAFDSEDMQIYAGEPLSDWQQRVSFTVSQVLLPVATLVRISTLGYYLEIQDRCIRCGDESMMPESLHQIPSVCTATYPFIYSTYEDAEDACRSQKSLFPLSLYIANQVHQRIIEDWLSFERNDTTTLDDVTQNIARFIRETDEDFIRIFINEYANLEAEQLSAKLLSREP